MTKKEYRDIVDAILLIVSSEINEAAYEPGLTLLRKLLKAQRKKWERLVYNTALRRDPLKRAGNSCICGKMLDTNCPVHFPENRDKI